jgi:hypothetical protein
MTSITRAQLIDIARDFGKVPSLLRRLTADDDFAAMAVSMINALLAQKAAKDAAASAAAAVAAAPASMAIEAPAVDTGGPLTDRKAWTMLAEVLPAAVAGENPPIPREEIEAIQQRFLELAAAA